MRRLSALLVAGLLVAAAAACSGSDDAEGPTIDTSDRSTDDEGLPLFTGEDTCEDETGDVQDAPADTTAEVLAAVDLVRAEVSEGDDVLHVEFETAGPVAPEDRLRLSVQKGRNTQDPAWFELRAVLADGVWTVTVHTLPPLTDPGRVTTEETRELPLPVTTDGSTYALDVRLADLPELDSSPTWQYGARLGETQGYIDLCSPFE